MQRPLRVLAAAAALMALFLSQMPTGVVAGTREAPEVTDAAEDQAGPNGLPGCPAPGQCPVPSTPVDLVAGWIANETATSLQFHIQATSAPPSGRNANNYTFTVTVDGTAYTAWMLVACEDASGQVCASQISFGGVAEAGAITADGVVMTVNKTALGDPAAGAALTAPTLTATATLLSTTQVVGSDEAGPGTDYALQSGPGGPTDDDTDADGLVDEWEQEHFGGLDETADGDPDGDGCDNACELASGTDPNEADTDGDGTSDGDEIAGGTDPTDPASRPPGTTTTSTSRPPGTTTTGTTGSDTTTTSTGGSGGEDDSFDARIENAMDTLYLPIAVGGALLILILALVFRGWRWRL